MTTRRLLRSIRAGAPQLRCARYVPECQAKRPAAHVSNTPAARTASNFAMIPLRSRALAGCDDLDRDLWRTQARDAASVETITWLTGESFRERDRQDTTVALWANRSVEITTLARLVVSNAAAHYNGGAVAWAFGTRVARWSRTMADLDQDGKIFVGKGE